MTQSRNAVSNLIARYKAVLKHCHMLNIMATAVVTGAVVLGSASMAMAGDVTIEYGYTGNGGNGNDFITAQDGSTELVDWETTRNQMIINAFKDLYLMNGYGNYTITGVDTTVTTKGTFTLNDNATITGGGTLDVYGYLTQSAGYTQDLSDINLVINEYAFTSNTSTYNAGALVLGDELAVGNVTFAQGTDLALFGNANNILDTEWGKVDGKTLTIAEGKTLTFAGDNEIRVSNPVAGTKSAVMLMGEGTIQSTGTLTISTNPVLMTTMTAETIDIIGDGDLTIGQCDDFTMLNGQKAPIAEGDLTATTINNMGEMYVDMGSVTVGTINNEGHLGIDGGMLVADTIKNTGELNIDGQDTLFIVKNGLALSATEKYNFIDGHIIALGSGLDLSDLSKESVKAFFEGGTSTAKATATPVTTYLTLATEGAEAVTDLTLASGVDTVILGNGSDGAFTNYEGALTVSGNGTVLDLGSEINDVNKPFIDGYNQGGTFVGTINVKDGGALDVCFAEWALGNVTVASGSRAWVGKDATLTVTSLKSDGDTYVEGTLGIDMTGADDDYTGIKGSVKFDGAAKLIISGAVIDEEDTEGDGLVGTLLADGSTLDGLSNDNITSDNQLLKITYNEGKITAERIGATEALSDIDPALADAIESYSDGDNDFLEKALAMDSDATTKAIESSAKVGAAAGVGSAIGNVSAAGAANIQVRNGSSSTTFSENDTSRMLAMNGDGSILPVDQAQEGLGIWFMPMYKHTSADGFKSGTSSFGYDTDLYGATLGADYTFASSLRLGLAFNVGVGESDSNGDYADTNNDFDYVGITAYGSMSFGQLALSADLGYTASDNEVTQDNAAGTLKADIDASLISAGIKAEYQVALDSFNITPYAGVRVNYYNVDSFDVGATQHTNASDYTIVEFPIGLTFDTTMQSGGWDITPSLGLGVKFAAGDLDPEQEVRFMGLDETSILSSEVADDITFQGALGLGFAKDAYSIHFGYTLDLSENVESHGLNLNLRYDF